MMINKNALNHLESLRKLSASDKELSYTLISNITSNLDLTKTQLNSLTTAYKAVGTYLANEGGWLANCYIYAQGSVGIGTVVRPIDSSSDMDVDLVLHLPDELIPLTNEAANQLLLKLIRVLQESDRYRDKVESEPKRRCIRLNYAGSDQGFHMDITPSIPEDSFLQNRINKVRVPDIKTANSPSHPYGYRKWFRAICAKEIRWSRMSTIAIEANIRKGEVEDLPGQTRRTVLQIVVQLLKRHRDQWQTRPENFHLANFAPISIIITTLAARAYEKCANSKTHYDSPWELILDVLELLPESIEKQLRADGSIEYGIKNPVMPEENFADKWRESPILKETFVLWFETMLDDFSKLFEFGQGLDCILANIEQQYGNDSVRGLNIKMADFLNERRAKGKAVVASVGLGLLGTAKAEQVKVPDHNFYGIQDSK